MNVDPALTASVALAAERPPNLGPVDFDSALTRYEPVLGFEVHVELSTNSKMFCGCPARFGGEPNTHVCPTCLGLPGALPAINGTAIESAIMIGLALNCSIAPWCRMARKNYFYPDMPKNFQISQYDEPLCVNGQLEVEVIDDVGRRRLVMVEIERVHLEEDTGKLTHASSDTGRIHGADYSLVDYNRAGVPLIEIVTKPIPGAGGLAPALGRAYVAALRELVAALGVSDVRMEEGSLRCDANVSIALIGSKEWGIRTETKNVNSLRSVERAIRSEIQRQAGVLDAGGRVIQETRHFHENTGATTAGRSKEQAEDYRYFPEPDLVPIMAAGELVEQLRSRIPELPAARKSRLRQAWGLSDFEMSSIVNAGALDAVEATVAAGADQSAARKWWLGELARRANELAVSVSDLSITPVEVARIVELVAIGTLTDKLAREVIDGVLAGEGPPDEVVVKRELGVVSDESALLDAIAAAVEANPEVAAKIRSGKVQAAGVIVGAVMKATRGQADAARVRQLLLDQLSR